MLLFYNLLRFLLAPFILLLLAAACLHPRYRARVPARLGFGLTRRLGRLQGPVFWVHALSVGELSSCAPLLRGLRSRWPEAPIVLSVTTKSGEAVARAHVAELCQAIVAAPYDLYPVVRHFIRTIRPAVFIQVETDFWPGWLQQLAQAGVPTLLVNGRITARSFARYQRFSWFFAPMFRCFSALCMQTDADADNMASLGLAPARIHTLGNLKFDAAETRALTAAPGQRQAWSRGLRRRYGFAEHGPLLLLGSTHPGEEELLLPVCARLRATIPDLQILLAPRQPGRAEAISALAAQTGLIFRRRSQPREAGQGPFLLLDTLGELAGCYPLADVAFIGGSLVPLGGHNPVEAAAAGIPVCFGPHMADFAEIAAAFEAVGGALRLELRSLEDALRRLLTDERERERRGGAALNWLLAQRGVVQRHLHLIEPWLSGP